MQFRGTDSSTPTTTVRRPRRLFRKLWIRSGVIGVAFLSVSAVTWQTSSAAFSSNTTNGANNWSAGGVTLGDDDTGSAMFNVSGMAPGATGTKCIKVTSTGTLAGGVRLYVTSPSTTNSLSSYINLTVEEGTGGTYSSCTGFSAGSTLFTGTLLAFGTARTSYANGVSTWALTGSPPEAKVYRFTYTLDAATPNSAGSGTAVATFTWEAQST